ncbi:PREDICTED: uncharacterized protein LOC101365365 [Odobenus rosmarus divergens]|uniref:Uncharacterized protein LOC101365365 n=1 Tax=Odobenus rosmarus divergens TaxID=9708 RepID=A0A9B0G9C0_ODORO
MLPCLPLLLLMGLSAGTVTADEGLALRAEAGSWITLTLEDGGIHFQLQKVKRGKASQFFGLMGKRLRGIPPTQPDRRTDGAGPCGLGAMLSLAPCPALPCRVTWLVSPEQNPSHHGQQQLHHQSIRKDKWCRASWAGRYHLQKCIL